MTHWTVLWITFLGSPYNEEQAFMIYPSIETCEMATATISSTLSYDHTIECAATDVLSSSIRPKRNPRYDG